VGSQGAQRGKMVGQADMRDAQPTTKVRNGGGLVDGISGAVTVHSTEIVCNPKGRGRESKNKQHGGIEWKKKKSGRIYNPTGSP